MQKLTINGTLPGLNEYTKACRTNKHAGNGMKIKAQASVLYAINMHKVKPFNNPVKVEFKWFEESKRRDLDNVAFAKKFIFDALVFAGILKGDGWAHVVGFSDAFEVDRDNPRIEVLIDEV